MRPFEHANATSTTEAISLLGQDWSSRPIAGGTDLLTEMKQEIVTPSRLVNLKTIPGLRDVGFDEATGLRLGALATLASIAETEVVRERYPTLHQAISLAASPQLRNVGTIGGNLNQSPRCWYYRGLFRCWLKGGTLCYARDGENAHHAIFTTGACNSVQPSDPATALIALGAQIRVAGQETDRVLPLEEYFKPPRRDHRRLSVLGPSEIVLDVTVPAPPQGSRGTYLKAMDRQVWAFALAGVAVQLTFDREVVTDARLVLGGVAATPWRVPDAEAALRGRSLDDAAIAQASEAAVAGARPLGHNKYKVSLVRGIVREALTSLRS